MINSERGKLAVCASRNVVKTCWPISLIRACGKLDETVAIRTQPSRSTVKLPDGSLSNGVGGLAKMVRRPIGLIFSWLIHTPRTLSSNAASRCRSRCLLVCPVSHSAVDPAPQLDPKAPAAAALLIRASARAFDAPTLPCARDFPARVPEADPRHLVSWRG